MKSAIVLQNIHKSDMNIHFPQNCVRGMLSNLALGINICNADTFFGVEKLFWYDIQETGNGDNFNEVVNDAVDRQPLFCVTK